MSKRKPDFAVHELTVKILQVLDKMQPGETVLWSVFSKAIGMDAATAGKHYVFSARKLMRRDKRRVYEAEPGIGIKYLTDKELANRGDYSIKRVHRMANRESDKISCVSSVEKLAQDDRRKMSNSQLMLGFLIAESSYEKRRQVDKYGNANGIPPNINPDYFKNS